MPLDKRSTPAFAKKGIVRDRDISESPSVLFVLPDLGKNGAIQQTLVVAEGVARSGSIRSAVFCLRRPRSYGQTASVPVSGPVEIDVVPFLRRLKAVSWINSKFQSLNSALRLIIKARHHDVIFASFEAGPALTQPAWVARVLRKPFCVIVHSNIPKSLAVHFPGWPREKSVNSLGRADHIVFVAQGLEPVMQEFLQDIPLPRHAAIRNGIDISSLDSRLQMPPCCNRDVAVESVGRFFLATGRISPEKGLDLLIEAHAKARKAGEEHLLVIAGEGSETLKSDLQAQASSLGVAESVRFIGHCDNPIGLLGYAYGFCLTSRYEGFSLALAEASAAGTPCIAMDCVAGPREILEGGKYGSLVPNGDVQAMANAMIAHLRDPVPLRQKAAASRSDANRLDRQPMIQEYVHLIEDLASRHRVRSSQT